MPLRKHAGQVAFPGGAVDDIDISLIVAALREAQEEVAIPPSAVEVIGLLPTVDSSTELRVTPVAGIIPPDLPWCANESEMAAVFEMPLATALSPEHYFSLGIHCKDVTHRVCLPWYHHYPVWGMTAGMLRELATQTCVMHIPESMS